MEITPTAVSLCELRIYCEPSLNQIALFDRNNYL